MQLTELASNILTQGQNCVSCISPFCCLCSFLQSSLLPASKWCIKSKLKAVRVFCRQKGVHEVFLWEEGQGIECRIRPQGLRFKTAQVSSQYACLKPWTSMNQPNRISSGKALLHAYQRSFLPSHPLCSRICIICTAHHIQSFKHYIIAALHFSYVTVPYEEQWLTTSVKCTKPIPLADITCMKSHRCQNAFTSSLSRVLLWLSCNPITTDIKATEFNKDFLLSRFVWDCTDRHKIVVLLSQFSFRMGRNQHVLGQIYSMSLILRFSRKVFSHLRKTMQNVFQHSSRVHII